LGGSTIQYRFGALYYPQVSLLMPLKDFPKNIFNPSFYYPKLVSIAS